MIWVSVVFTAPILLLQARKLLHRRQWVDLCAQLVLLSFGLVCSAALSLHLWMTVDFLSPVKAVFTPITEWMYALL
ncbi:hypothetical protein [Alicyclobacillus sp. ALC3]|uniref:hypothetical protein n=1 Tax=Alicyclobacillus sp. ALC3 TaxID=2796143 RepID=UPI002378AE8B|nr:hypothetical protein [Alicyclobacillus sp. ALC3]WDL97870.1 hypothetical protein JC200_03850 [Alicyclobacillus sp. ALC3]